MGSYLSNPNVEESSRDADGYFLVHRLAKTGSPEEMENYLRHNSNGIKARTRFQGFTPLMVAAIQGRLEMVEMLIRNNADLGMKSYDRSTALHCALQEKDKPRERNTIARTIVTRQTDLLSVNNLTNNLVQTPLHLAAKQGNPWATKTLIDALRKPHRGTPWMMVYGEHPLDVRDWQNQTALEVATVKMSRAADDNDKENYWRVMMALVQGGALIQVPEDIRQTRIPPLSDGIRLTGFRTFGDWEFWQKRKRSRLRRTPSVKPSVNRYDDDDSD